MAWCYHYARQLVVRFLRLILSLNSSKKKLLVSDFGPLLVSGYLWVSALIGTISAHSLYYRESFQKHYNSFQFIMTFSLDGSCVVLIYSICIFWHGCFSLDKEKQITWTQWSVLTGYWSKSTGQRLPTAPTLKLQYMRIHPLRPKRKKIDSPLCRHDLIFKRAAKDIY